MWYRIIEGMYHSLYKAYIKVSLDIYIIYPILMMVPPVTPRIFVAANANGAEESINSLAGTIAAIAMLTKIYKIRIVKTEAIKTLGIVS